MSLKIFNFELRHGLPRSTFTENLGFVDVTDGNAGESTLEAPLEPTLKATLEPTFEPLDPTHVEYLMSGTEHDDLSDELDGDVDV